MRLLLSANNPFPSKTLFSPLNHPPSISLQNISKLSLKPPPRQKRSPISASLSSTSNTATATATATIPDIEAPQPLSNWGEFAKRVSGEWDGFGADFTSSGSPVELPHNVVPEAYREWEVKVFDWQTQCPTLASETGDPVLSYKLVKLLPTVGCEADAATRHSVDERIAGGSENTAIGIGFSESGSYVAVWPVEGFGGKRLLEIEHCLVDARNKEVRVRVVMVVKEEGDGGDGEGCLKLEGIRVFSEQWYGPWRNGEQMGGCAIREAGFAQSGRVEVGDVVGVWEGRRLGFATFESGGKDVLRELVEDRPESSMIRDQGGLIALPKNLWCSLKETEDGETLGEVGWLLDRGVAMTSRCVFLRDGTLKEMGIARETAVLEDM